MKEIHLLSVHDPEISVKPEEQVAHTEMLEVEHTWQFATLHAFTVIVTILLIGFVTSVIVELT